MNIYEKLNKARVKLQESKIKKTGKNQAFNYFELDDFVPELNKICEELKLTTVTSIVLIEGQKVADLKIFNSENPEEFIHFTTPTEYASLRGNNPVQEVGATITYMRRYLLMMAFEITEPDKVDSQPLEETKSIASDKQINFINKLIKQGNIPEDKAKLIMDNVKVGISKDMASKIIEKYKE